MRTKQGLSVSFRLRFGLFLLLTFQTHKGRKGKETNRTRVCHCVTQLFANKQVGVWGFAEGKGAARWGVPRGGKRRGVGRRFCEWKVGCAGLTPLVTLVGLASFFFYNFLSFLLFFYLPKHTSRRANSRGSRGANRRRDRGVSRARGGSTWGVCGQLVFVSLFFCQSRRRCTRGNGTRGCGGGKTCPLRKLVG
jgi:hypothetical protein